MQKLQSQNGEELFHQLKLGRRERERETGREGQGDKWSEEKEEKIGCWVEVD